jgi:alanyl-tRNA synthetase
MAILQQVMAKAKGEIDGSTAFLLYDTYGFPLDLTQDIARENGLGVDQKGFNAEMAQQQERGRSSSQFAQRSLISADTVASLPETEFLGYERLETPDSRIAGIVVDGELSDRLEEGQNPLFTRSDSFYAGSGEWETPGPSWARLWSR